MPSLDIVNKILEETGREQRPIEEPRLEEPSPNIVNKILAETGRAVSSTMPPAAGLPLELPKPGAPIPEEVRRLYKERHGKEAPTHYPTEGKDLPWWADMALAAASYGITAAALGLATGGVGVVGTSALAAPVYMAARQAITGKPYTPVEAAEEMAWWAGMPLALKGLGIGVKKLPKGIEYIGKRIPEKVTKFLEPVEETLWENLTIKPGSLTAKIPYAERVATKVRELVQPAIERIEQEMPKVAATFRRSAVYRSLSTEAGRQLQRDLEKELPSVRFEVVKSLESGTPLSSITDPRARAIVDRYRTALREFKPENYYRLKFEEEVAKGLMKPFRDVDVPGGRAILERIERAMETGKPSEWQEAFKRIIQDPLADEQTKQFLKDVWNIPASTPIAVADAAREASTEYLVWKLARHPGLVSPKPKPGYVESTFGSLKGLWVPKDVELELRAIKDIPKYARSWYNKWFMSPWKTSKVILRPATHFRNLFSNIILNDWGGLPFYRVDVYIDALKQMRNNSPAWREFRRLTGVGATFAQSDIYNLESGLRYGATIFDRLYNLYDKMTAVPRSLYNVEESWFKFAKYLHNLEQKMPKSEAALDAVKWTFNYSEITPLVAKARTYAIPFVTWQAKVLPLMAETAVKHPIRFWKWVLFGMYLQSYALEKVGLSEEEWDHIEKTLPEYLQKGMYLMMPWRDSKGRLQLLNMTYAFPGIGDLNEIWTRIHGAAPEGAMGTAIQTPLVHIPAAIISKKKFSGAPLYYDWELPETKWAKALAYVWETLSPAIVPGGTDWNLLWKALHEEEGAPTAESALASWFGFKLTPVDPGLAAVKKEHLRRMTEGEITMEMNRELRRARTGEEVEAILEKYRRIRERALLAP